jgi:lipopolysaccharide export system protein LptA
MNDRPRLRAGLGGAIAFCCALSCLQAGAQQEKTVHLEHADSLIGLTVDGEQARKLVGNVRFTQGTVEVRCQRAIQYLVTNRIALEGTPELFDGKMHMVATRGMYYGDTKTAEGFDRVMIEESTTTLKARYGKYFAGEKKAYFDTDVSVEDQQSVLTSNQFTYFRDEQHTIATGNVKIVSRTNNLTIFGEHFENFKKNKFSRMTGHPRVLDIDQAGAGRFDTLTVEGVVLESYQDSTERLIARDSVHLRRGPLVAEAGQCVMFTELDSLILRKAPFVWYADSAADHNQLSGDSIFIKLLHRKLQKVFVRGSAFAISTTDTLFPARFNQMSGEEIIFTFDSSKIRQIDVDKTATSMYYLYEDRKGNGMNKTTGDHVTLIFANGRFDRLKALSGVEGQYYPEKMIRTREAEYNLTGFNWREPKPRNTKVKK